MAQTNNHHHHHHHHHEEEKKPLTPAQKRKLWKKWGYRALVVLTIVIGILCVLAHFFE
jgi:hypothetical protein